MNARHDRPARGVPRFANLAAHSQRQRRASLSGLYPRRRGTFRCRGKRRGVRKEGVLLVDLFVIRAAPASRVLLAATACSVAQTHPLLRPDAYLASRGAVPALRGEQVRHYPVSAPL
jgi:hypothetical protein